MSEQCPAMRQLFATSISYLRFSGITIRSMATRQRPQWTRLQWPWSKHWELPFNQREEMKQRVRTITVFGSSCPGESENDYMVARQLGSELAKRGFSICNGGYGGVMEAVSRGANDAGGRAIGIKTRFFEAAANHW